MTGWRRSRTNGQPRSSSEFRSFGADDFSHYCETAPGLMMFVGVPGEQSLHDERFLPPDDTVERVARPLVAGYLAALGTP